MHYEEREARLLVLREHIDSALANGGSHTDEEVEAFLANSEE